MTSIRMTRDLQLPSSGAEYRRRGACTVPGWVERGETWLRYACTRELDVSPASMATRWTMSYDARLKSRSHHPFPSKPAFATHMMSCTSASRYDICASFESYKFGSCISPAWSLPPWGMHVGESLFRRRYQLRPPATSLVLCNSNATTGKERTGKLE